MSDSDSLVKDTPPDSFIPVIGAIFKDVPFRLIIIIVFISFILRLDVVSEILFADQSGLKAEFIRALILALLGTVVAVGLGLKWI